jgi:hypothetical protein
MHLTSQLPKKRHDERGLDSGNLILKIKETKYANVLHEYLYINSVSEEVIFSSIFTMILGQVSKPRIFNSLRIFYIPNSNYKAERIYQ